MVVLRENPTLYDSEYVYVYRADLLMTDMSI